MVVVRGRSALLMKTDDDTAVDPGGHFSSVLDQNTRGVSRGDPEVGGSKKIGPGGHFWTPRLILSISHTNGVRTTSPFTKSENKHQLIPESLTRLIQSRVITPLLLLPFGVG
jgi:hypothetical protein